MKKRKIDSDLPIGKWIRVKDFLPPPSELAKAPMNVKITISLSLESVEFFQKQAEKHHTKYQKMIREVLDQYVARYKAA